MKSHISEKLTFKDKLLNIFNKNIILVFIWAIIVFLSSVITLYQGSKILVDVFNKSIGEKNYLYKKLSLLTPNVNISNFIGQLGKPSITHQNKETKEFIFVDKYFYVQAITDLKDMVTLYSVTSRAEDFKPKFKIPGYDPKNKESYIILNESTFSDVFEKIEKYKGDDYGIEDTINPMCYTYLGAHRFVYFEGTYLGNAGNYQSFYIGLNDAGYWKYDENIEMPGPFSIKNINDCLTVSENFRKKQIVNTYVETTRFAYMPEEINEFPALKDDEVRVIDKK